MYSTDPVADAAAYYEPRFAAADMQAKAEQAAGAALMAACRSGNVNALATFAPMVKDFEAARKLQDVKAPVPMRYQTLSEVMQDALDYTHGPCMSEAMQLLLNLAYGNNLENTQHQAQLLIERIKEAFVQYNVEISK